MGSFYVPITDILVNAGCQVAVGSINEGWERRSRSSGGFESKGAILAVQWHHTASSASVNSDLSYMVNGSPDKPVGNVLLDRDGVFWPIAAGAANTSGKGGPNNFSRGTCPKDSGNTRLFSIEIANSGVGEPYPQAQIDAAFRGSNALNAHFGNQPTDVVSHALGAGDGYTDRKIDPATAAGVQGPWRPGSVNSSGTWSLADLRHECGRRSQQQPTPTPPPKEDDDNMIIYAFRQYANTFSQQGVHLSPEAYTELVNQGAVVVYSELTWPLNYHLDSLLAMSGLNPDYLVPIE